MLPQKYRRIIIPSVIVLLLALGYWYIATKTPPADTNQIDAAGGTVSAPTVGSQSATSTNTAAGDAVVDSETLSLLTDLRAVSLSSGLFESQSFQSLQDFEVTIPARAKGREDPFAPIDENEPTGTTTGVTGP